MSLPVANYPGALPRAQMYQRLLTSIRAIPGVQAASAMSGLPPNRPLDANDTDIDNYTAPPEGPFENVDYYQSVMTDYFETMGIPMVAGRSFAATDAASEGPVVIVDLDKVQTPRDVRLLRKGRGKLVRRVERIVNELIEAGTVKSTAQPVVIVVRESMSPLSLLTQD